MISGGEFILLTASKWRTSLFNRRLEGKRHECCQYKLFFRVTIWRKNIEAFITKCIMVNYRLSRKISECEGSIRELQEERLQFLKKQGNSGNLLTCVPNPCHNMWHSKKRLKMVLTILELTQEREVGGEGNDYLYYCRWMMLSHLLIICPKGLSHVPI